jgi:hypothetical protein
MDLMWWYLEEEKRYKCELGMWKSEWGSWNEEVGMRNYVGAAFSREV